MKIHEFWVRVQVFPFTFGLNLSSRCDHVNHLPCLLYAFTCFQIKAQTIAYQSYLMGSVCSRRRCILPGDPTLTSFLARRRWRSAIKRVMVLIRLRKTWACLGRYLQRSHTGELFSHLRSTNGLLSHRFTAHNQPRQRTQPRRRRS